VSLLRRIENSQPDGSNDQPSKLQQLREQRSPTMGAKDAYTDLKNRIQQKLIAELDPALDVSQSSEMRSTIQEMFETMLLEEQIVLTRSEKQRLFEQIVAEILGYGPLERYLNLEGKSYGSTKRLTIMSI